MMVSRILLVFATQSEAAVLGRIHDLRSYRDEYKFRDFTISVIITGVGGISTSWSMGKWLFNNPLPDLTINAGIAGSFTDNLKNGDVVVPVSDCFADMAVESGSDYLTLAEAGLMNPDEFPFEKGFIKAENKYVREAIRIYPGVKAITVNTASGTKPTIERLKNKYNPDIETMEGATFFYICSMEKIPFLGLRAISNKVEARKVSLWDIPLALQNLAEALNNIFTTLK
jgi:futalosine hydrolase